MVLTLGESLTFQMGGNVVRHLVRLPLGYFERRHVGDLLSRVDSIKPIQSLLTQGLVNVLIDSALMLTTLFVMAMISPLLTFLVVGLTSSIWPSACFSIRACGGAPKRRSWRAPTRKPI